MTVCRKKRKGTGKTGNFTGKSDIITQPEITHGCDVVTHTGQDGQVFAGKHDCMLRFGCYNTDIFERMFSTGKTSAQDTRY